MNIDNGILQNEQCNYGKSSQTALSGEKEKNLSPTVVTSVQCSGIKAQDKV
jgi:hypothetical protein